MKTDERPFAERLDDIADAIREVSKLGQAIQKSDLEQRAICVLLHDRLPAVSISNIKAVLNMLPELESTYLKPKKQKQRG